MRAISLHIESPSYIHIVCEIKPYYSFQCILSKLYRHVTNIVKICMNKLMLKHNIKKKLQIFKLSYVQTTAHCGRLTVSRIGSQFMPRGHHYLT